jgi:REP element-mobilizing transposase RayT
MTYNPTIHHRRSIRLKEYDYSQAGAYFITICSCNREHMFGEIVDSTMVLNEYGKIVNTEWLKTPEMRPNIELDEFIIMPNHFHGIIIINDVRRGTMHRAPTIEQFGKPTSNTIPTIIRGFKSIVTKQINIMRNTPGFPVWQRNYYEHIIRDDESYIRISEYIKNNPIHWDKDDYYGEL